MISWLAQGYFAANALLYAAVAVRTSLDPGAAAAKSGFALDSRGSRAEFLTAYGGLTFALAIVFTILAITPDAHRVGLKGAVAFYVPIIAYRLAPPLLAGDRYAFAAGPTMIEALLLACAVALLLFPGMMSGGTA